MERGLSDGSTRFIEKKGVQNVVEHLRGKVSRPTLQPVPKLLVLRAAAAPKPSEPVVFASLHGLG